MSQTETAARAQVAIFRTSHLQTAAVFAAWGWPVQQWWPLGDDTRNGRRRAEFELAVPEEMLDKAQEIEAGCANGMMVPVPDVGAYNRAFQMLKHEIENEDLRNERMRTDGRDD